MLVPQTTKPKPAEPGPPKDVAPTTLWDRLVKAERPRRNIPFPRKGLDGQPVGTLDIVILFQSEILHCTAVAEGYAREMLKNQNSPGTSQGYYDIFQQARVCELLWKACKDDQNPERPDMPAFGLSAAEVPKRLTSDEIAVLFQAYQDWQTESGPIIADMSVEEMDAWIDRLKEAGTRLPLAALSSEARTDLLMHSIARLAKCETGNTSSGAQRESSSESPSPPSLASDEAPPAAVT